MSYKLNLLLSVLGLFLIMLISLRSQGYAEIHYTFWGYSLIIRNYPEVLVDAPWRVNPNESVPVVFIIKDADVYPITLNSIIIRCRAGDDERSFSICKQPTEINQPYWYQLYFIEPFWSGKDINLEISATFDFVRKGKQRVVVNDNFPGLSHGNLNVFVSSEELPSFDGWFYGDAHYHSDLTQDQVEFGAPIEVAMAMGKALGLRWFATTDHSYDLDVVMGRFFERDHNLTRWKRLLEVTQSINSSNNDFAVLPAEEISCGNCKRHNVHMLAFNSTEFIPGKGDGVKTGLNRKPNLTISEVIQRIRRNDGFAYAAHPEDGNGFMGTMLLNRGHWKNKDYYFNDYTGLQFWNGDRDKSFFRAYKKWIELLLSGKKVFVLGGNDAHGDFNRCRGVRYPNTKLKESNNHVFGRVRTCAYSGTMPISKGVIQSLREGKTVVTDGPLAIIEAQNDNGKVVGIGETISGRKVKVIVNVKSSGEFGKVQKVNLYKGVLNQGQEILEECLCPEEMHQTLSCETLIEGPCYIRAEAVSLRNSSEYSCLTNPIWLFSA